MVNHKITKHKRSNSHHKITKHKRSNSHHKITKHKRSNSHHKITKHKRRNSQHKITKHKRRKSSHKITKHKRRNSNHKITKYKKRGGSSLGNSSINRAIYTPTTTEELKNTIILFRNKDNIQTLLSTYGEMRSWNVSQIRIMSSVFEGYTFDNTYDTITNWDVSNVENMESMFFKSTNFNQNLSGWNVSNVENMESMFDNCLNFNQNLSGWDVSKVEDMELMFNNCLTFNSDLSGWNVSNVENMESMFNNCELFNQNLSGWDVSKVGNMKSIFYNCYIFNSDLSGWDVSNVRNMESMFENCFIFNQNLSGWDVSNVENMKYMFENCEIFNQDLSGWNVSNVENMESMFNNCLNFNQNLSGWDVSNVEHEYMLTDTAMIPEHMPQGYEGDFPGVFTTPTGQNDQGLQRPSEHFISPIMYEAVVPTVINICDTDNIPTTIREDTTYDLIEGVDINVLTFLNEDNNNIIFYFLAKAYSLTKDRLLQLCMDSVNLRYSCNNVMPHLLFMTPDLYNREVPYLSGRTFGCPCGLLEVSKLKTIITGPVEDQIFVIKDFDPIQNAVSTVSIGMIYNLPNAAVSGSHCQEGQESKIHDICKLVMSDLA